MVSIAIKLQPLDGGSNVKIEERTTVGRGPFLEVTIGLQKKWTIIIHYHLHFVALDANERFACFRRINEKYF